MRVQLVDGSIVEAVATRSYSAAQEEIGTIRQAKVHDGGLGSLFGGNGLEPSPAFFGSTPGTFSPGDKVWVITDQCTQDFSGCRYQPEGNSYNDYVVGVVVENDVNIAEWEEYVTETQERLEGMRLGRGIVAY